MNVQTKGADRRTDRLTLPWLGQTANMAKPWKETQNKKFIEAITLKSFELFSEESFCPHTTVTFYVCDAIRAFEDQSVR